MSVRVTFGEIMRVVNEKKGARPITLIAETDPRLRKTGLPQEWRKIIKRTKLNGIANHIYGNSVNLQRMREDIEEDFIPLPRKWGERIQGTSWVKHKDSFYLEIKVERVMDSRFFLGGTEISREDLRPFLPATTEGARQGTDKKVILRDFKLENLREVKVGGVEYVLAEA